MQAQTTATYWHGVFIACMVTTIYFESFLKSQNRIVLFYSSPIVILRSEEVTFSISWPPRLPWHLRQQKKTVIIRCRQEQRNTNFIVQVQHIEVSNWWRLASTQWRSQQSFSWGLVYSFEWFLQFVLFIIHYLASRAQPHWRAASDSSRTHWTLTFLSHLTPYYI